MTKIEILNKYKKQKHNTYREFDVINAMEKYLESYKKDQALQLQQTGVSGCFSKEEVVNIILEFTNIALHSNSHNLTREELRELLRIAKNGWLNNRCLFFLHKF